MTRSESSSGERDGGGDATSRHILLAIDGDEHSLSWLVERFDPCLYASARVHLGPKLLRTCDPDDLVMEVWAVALAKLPQMRFDSASSTRGLLAFFGTTMRHTVNNLLRRGIRSLGAGGSAAPDHAGVDDVPAGVTSVTGRARHGELRARFAAALEELDEADRQIIMQRGIEQRPYRDIALVAGGDVGALAVRYRRALEKLRRRLPGSILDELSDLH